MLFGLSAGFSGRFLKEPHNVLEGLENSYPMLDGILGGLLQTAPASALRRRQEGEGKKIMGGNKEKKETM